MTAPKCNVCDAKDSLSPHPFISNAYVCKDHKPKHGNSVESSERKEKPIAPSLEPSYSLDISELKALRMDGLLPIKTYVFLALMIDNPSGLKKIDMGLFCSRWGIPSYEVLQAIGQLARKGLINLKPQDIEAEIVTRNQRMKNLEDSINA